ncbi:MAG: hypothetical protein HYY93_00715 [Planctomycetes bacterium]|nr:hypothetical protein [Planctomycetota bacterium]
MKRKRSENPSTPCLVLTKGEHRYFFRVERGCEVSLVCLLIDYAMDPRFNLTFDDVMVFVREVRDTLRPTVVTPSAPHGQAD